MRNLAKVKTVIIKIGSSSLVKENLAINEPIFDSVMSSLSTLQKEGIRVALVTSGAIAVGMHELGFTSKPKEMEVKQACASLGQAKLMEVYNRFAAKYELKCGQILLNHDDFQFRDRMGNLSKTMEAMFHNNIIPIINENDALAVEEIKVGDNDTLASLLCPMIGADLLILFSDIDGLYDKNPKLYSDAKLITNVSSITKDIVDSAKGKSGVGTGGMKTKLKAALIATSSHSDMIICNSTQIPNLLSIVNGEEIGTLFEKKDNAISSRESWLIFKAKSKGSITVDDGCKEALLKKKISILPKGIVSVQGEFLKGAVIDILDSKKTLLGKGVSKFSSLEIQKIKGQDSIFIPGILGYVCKEEVIHANDLVELGSWSSSGLEI